MGMRIAVDPGHGMGALTPGVLDEGNVAQYRGERITEQHLALVYGVALEEALGQLGAATLLLRADSRQARRLEELREFRADLVVGVHFLAADDRQKRGFVVAVNQAGLHPLAWKLWDEMGHFLPSLAGPRSVLTRGFVIHGENQITLYLGCLSSALDLELITEGYWKLRLCETVAGVLADHFTAAVAA